LAFVVPAVAIVFLAGGVVALINGYGGAGALALAIGVVVAGFVIWFVRLPVRHDETDRTP